MRTTSICFKTGLIPGQTAARMSVSALEFVVRWLRNCGMLRPPQVTPATAKSWVQRTGGLAFGVAEGLPGRSSLA